MPNKMPPSKRLRFAIYVFHVFVGIGIYGIAKGADMAGLGAYLAATAIPLIAYVLGETYRKSE